MRLAGKILTLAASTLGVGGLALAALAADTPIAPYAQAAALRTANGTITNSKNVTQVAKVGTGKYCVQLHSDISAARAVPIATLRSSADWRSEIYTNVESSSCSSHPNSVFVYTGKNGEAADEPFFLLIP
ncbi:hypothetical protein DMB42_02185 [Nonomuraea sp. WAC 01424]|uniref:hypothetical protein n=1 Tax=Nonomuraea sp. WAC 01424 TaxID=2203200 RepID=UPI000F79C2FA|nr:hypothetical protein [Nonomuraea sp. WAC 01424]RSN15642.1 hypothetical protein DMB42_02185 [Nonomuraea sp. WAC 01424]